MSKKVKIALLSIIFIMVICILIYMVVVWCIQNNQLQLPAYSSNELSVHISEEYKDDYMNQRFTVEDFDCKYIESIRYDMTNEVGDSVICVTVKDKYTNRLKRVIRNVERLEFVSKVEKIPVYIALPVN